MSTRLLGALLMLILLFGSLLAPALARGDGSQTLPTLTISVLQFGTAHWELDHIQHFELDRQHGYNLDLRLVANLPASRLAVTSGSVNGAVADLLWAQARYAAGVPYLYVPFSSQIGDIVVADDSQIRSVQDLAGKRIGVAGGPDSKGWILLQQVAASQGLDLNADSSVQFAAPPLLNQALKRKQVDVIVTYWHFAARLRGEGGWRSAFRMADLLHDLDLDANLPVLGYVFADDWAQENAALVDRFARSLAKAKDELAGNPSHWQRLRPLMNNPDDGVFAELRDGFIAGNPADITPDRLADLRRLLILTGANDASVMDESLFYRGAL